MGLSDRVIQTITNLWTGKKVNGNWFYALNQSADTFNAIDCLKAYQEIPEVNAPINLKARAFSNMKLKEVDKDGQEVSTPDGQKLINLIKKANWFQEGKEFLIYTKVLREIYGNEYLYKTSPLGFDPTLDRVKALHSIPAGIVKPKYDNSVPFFMYAEAPKVTYKVKQENKEDLPIDSKYIIHFNDNRAEIKSATDEHLLTGESKLMPLSCVINNLRMAYESRGVILKYRGANGAWTNAGKDGVGNAGFIDPAETDKFQQAFSKYGTLKGQHQTIVTSLPLVWNQSGTNNPNNLGLFDETKYGFNKIIDSFGVPPEMFVRDSGSTYENQKQAEKGMYVRTIIPEANEWTFGLASEFMDVSKTTIIADYFHLPIFQEDLKSRGDAMSVVINALSKALQDQAITIEQYQDEIKKFGINF
jgi:Phage portal protein